MNRREPLREEDLHPDHPLVQFAAESARRAAFVVELPAVLQTGFQGKDAIGEVQRRLLVSDVLLGPTRQLLLCEAAELEGRFGSKLRSLRAYSADFIEPLQVAFGMASKRGAPKDIAARTFVFTLNFLSRAAGVVAIDPDRLHTLAMSFGLARAHSLNEFGRPRRGPWNKKVKEADRVLFDASDHARVVPENSGLAHLVSELSFVLGFPNPTPAELVEHVMTTQPQRPRVSPEIDVIA
jgi:hypothetical protein